MILFLALPVQTTWASADVTTWCKHKPPKKEYIPGFRILLDLKLKDETGLLAQRCYFKAKNDKVFTFVNLNRVGDSEYQAVLPAPWVNSEYIEYLFVTVNQAKQVMRTQLFKIVEAETDEAAEWQDASEVEEVRIDKAQEAAEAYEVLRKKLRDKYKDRKPNYQIEGQDVMTVMTEVDEAMVSLNGFYDGITVSQVPAASSYGVLAEGIYTAEQVATVGGAAAATTATGATTAGVIDAATGMSGAAIAGIGVGAAAVLGGGAVAGAAIADDDDDDDEDAPAGTTPCNEQTVAGSNAPESHTIFLGQSSGTFVFEFNTVSVPDRMQVTYEGRVLYDSGCVGTRGDRRISISYAGSSEVIGVNVIPNCAGSTFTAWDFTVFCP